MLALRKPETCLSISPQNHKNTFTVYCNFVHLNCQINILLDKNACEAFIKTQKAKIFNNAVMKILFDSVKTIEKQNLASRGSGADTL